MPQQRDFGSAAFTNLSSPPKFVGKFHDQSSPEKFRERMIEFLHDVKINFYETIDHPGGVRFRVSITNQGLYFLMQIVSTLWNTEFDVFFSKVEDGPTIYRFSPKQLQAIDMIETAS